MFPKLGNEKLKGDNTKFYCSRQRYKMWTEKLTREKSKRTKFDEIQNNKGCTRTEQQREL